MSFGTSVSLERDNGVADRKPQNAVGDVEVLTHVKGWPSLEEAAIAAVRQRTYRPGMKDGHPVSIHFTIKVDFRLK